MSETDDPDAESRPSLQDIPWRQIAHVAGLIVLIAVVLPFVVYAVPQVVGADHSYVVLSGSMEPTISPGDAIIVDSVDASEIDRGDIVVFFRSGETRPTTHRVIGVTEQDGSRAFRTKGDANEGPDQSLVTPRQIQGRVMSIGGHLFVIPYIGHVIQFANTQIGFILLLAVPLLLLVGSEIWSVVASARPDAEPGGTAAEGSSGTGTGTGTADRAAEDAEPEAAEAGIAFSAAELQFGLVVLAAFLLYSVWVAYATLTTWAFAAAGGVGAAFLLLSGLYLVGGSSKTASADGEPVDVDEEPADGEPADGEPADEGSQDGEPADEEPADGTGGPDSVVADGSGDSPGTDRGGDTPSPAIGTDVELNLLDDLTGQQGDNGPKEDENDG